MNCTIIVVTRLSRKKVHSTFINLEGEMEPYIVGISQYGPPFHVVGNPLIPTEVGATEVTVNNHGEDDDRQDSKIRSKKRKTSRIHKAKARR